MSFVQVGSHVPPTHFGVADGHSVSLAQPPLFGTQPPFWQVLPLGQPESSAQPATHCPFSQIFPVAQSLLYLHVFFGSVQAPPTHTCPFEHWSFVVHGQGPWSPPHAWQWFVTQTLPLAQSFVVVHSSGVPASVVVGGTHSPVLQTVPLAQSLVCWQVVVHEPLMHVCPVGQLEFPVHDCDEGGVTVPQP